MPVEFRAASSGVRVGSGTLTLDKPSGVVAGEVMLAGFTGVSGTAISASDWTLLAEQIGGNRMKTIVLYRIAGGSEPASYNFTVNSNVTAGVIALSGADTDPTKLTTSTSSGADSSSYTLASIATVAGGMTVGFVGARDADTNGSVAPNTGYTERYDRFVSYDTSGGATQVHIGEGQTQPTTALGTQVARSGSFSQIVDDWATVHVALRPIERKDWIGVMMG